VRKEVNVYKLENHTPDFIKINPARQIPAITDGSFNLAESHTILRYLHSTRECADHWYPSCSKKRAMVDQYLDWHHTNLRAAGFGLLKKIFILPMFGKHPQEQ
jgi:glutathione S-transferase